MTKAALCMGLRCCGHYYGNETKGCYGERNPSRMVNCNGITRRKMGPIQMLQGAARMVSGGALG